MDTIFASGGCRMEQVSKGVDRRDETGYLPAMLTVPATPSTLSIATGIVPLAIRAREVHGAIRAPCSLRAVNCVIA
ncbi:MAG: hypothetical protein JWR10_2302 [Rubritepida sp.]|nr:hypothetical protein [Rubritepida sp.]